MSFEVPQIEPDRVVAGDTWGWKRADLGDYPASDGWTLKYRFKHQTNAGFEIVATASGADHLVSVAASTTAGYSAGNYKGEGWVEGGTSEKYTVWRGELLVEINFRAGTTAASVVDARTDSRVIYDQLIAAYRTWSVSNGSIKAYVIGDRSVTFDSQSDILRQISFWEIRVKNEEAAERLRSGERGGKRIMVRL